MQKELFYHYTSIDCLKRIICNNCFHATHIKYLNDPSEDEYYKGLLQEYLNANPLAKNIYLNLYDSSYEDKFDKNEKYVISFSECSDCLSLWYYAKGNGCNLGIKIDNIMGRTKKIKSIVKAKIVYNENEQFDVLNKLFNSYENISEQYQNLSAEMDNYTRFKNENECKELYFEQSQLIVKFMGEFSLIKKMLKHPKFLDEREIRLVIEPYEQYYNVSYRKSDRGTRIPYIIIPININEDISSITLDPSRNETDLNSLNNFLMNENLKIKSSQSGIPFREI